MGDRENDTSLLQRSVAAHEAALTFLTRERFQLDWAKVQARLGDALRSLGERESGTESLTKAIAAYGAALGGSTRERDALLWALTQSKLGRTLLVLGKRMRDKSVIASGRQSIESAWEVYRLAKQTHRMQDYSQLLKDFDNALTQLNP